MANELALSFGSSHSGLGHLGSTQPFTSTPKLTCHWVKRLRRQRAQTSLASNGFWCLGLAIGSACTRFGKRSHAHAV